MIFPDRKLLLSAFAASAAAFLPVAQSRAELKIGLVDVNRVFQSSAKTKAAEAKINEAKKSATAEFNVRVDAYKKALDETNRLNQQLEAPALSTEAKAGKAAERDNKIAQIRAMEREMTEFRQTREQELGQQLRRAKEQIVREITDVVLKLARAKDLDLVFDKSGASINGFSPVLFARADGDFTNEVIAALQKAERPSASPPVKP